MGHLLHILRDDQARIRGELGCTGNCRQGRDCTCQPDTISTDYGAMGCAPEGGKHREPSKTIKRDRGLIVGALLVLCGWPAAVAVVGVIASAAAYLPHDWLQRLIG